MSNNLVNVSRLGRKPKDFNLTSLLDIIEEAYVNSRPKERYSKKVSFSPSSVGYGAGTCPRYWYLAFEGGNFVDTFDGLSIANMSNGTLAHQRIEKLFEDSGLLIEAERELKYADPPIRGFADVIIEHEGVQMVGEFKTTRQESYVHREANNAPIDYHKVQVLIYMRILGFKHGFLLYENKNTQELFLIPLEMNAANSEYTDYIFNWMKEVRALWENQTLPKRPFTEKNKACKSCSLFDVCRTKTEDGTINYLPLEVKK
ncbi:Cas4 family exonuclease [Streptomyces phage Coruscant]|uniref:Cas4 family exonuclease n=1 Tax=Streptomyces phage Coruscant TaxID=2739834 RepID=A0A7G4AW29_9CAUD|nr:CRISPR/Cas system associated [Streptomyces phage Coruscant]QMP84219.1 Cas4 family exonuclease [Streptomyces phage Coruscant]